MIKGVVFDMDGLMFDSERLINLGWHFAGEQAGFDITDEIIYKTLGIDLENTKRVFMEEMGADFDYDWLDRTRVLFMQDYVEKNGVPFKPGLMELLDYLKARDYKMAVATSTPEDQARHLLQKAGVLAYFEDIVCGDMIEHGKPEPEIYLKACGAIGMVPADCMALEDSPAGILAAFRAGMTPVMIPDLMGPDEETTKIYAARLETLFDVAGWLERHNNKMA
jgi:HAD superfamily hydrolase (TIGR01509 family)